MATYLSENSLVRDDWKQCSIVAWAMSAILPLSQLKLISAMQLPSFIPKQKFSKKIFSGKRRENKKFAKQNKKISSGKNLRLSITA